MEFFYNLVISSPRSDPDRSSLDAMVLLVDAVATMPPAEPVLELEDMPDDEDLTFVFGSL